jgi:hypothetical protein
MRTYRFIADLRCHLANGELQIVRGYKVAVYAGSLRQAARMVEATATEMVHDAGGELLDAPLEHLVVIAVKEDEP